MNPLLFAALLCLAGCSLDRSRETTLVRGQQRDSDRDMDDKLFRLETLRLQRDMLENDRLRLWQDRAPAPVFVPRAKRR
jgi:hypothetical protein